MKIRKLLALSITSAIIFTPTAVAFADDDTNPLVPLVEDFGTYWQAPGKPYDGTGTSGKVLNSKVLDENDKAIVAINHAGAKAMTDTSITNQQKRALSDRDADDNVAFEMKDGFGPILGTYFEEGYNNGDIDLVKDIMEGNGWSGNPSKKVHQFPRPFTQRDTWLPEEKDHVSDGNNDLQGIPATLDIIKVPDSIGADGVKHSADYPKNTLQGSFPSGHTNKAYSRGVVLAAMIPQLAPEILARMSEAGNNRIVLGVHYPLDVIAGRMGGMASVAAYWKDNEKQMKEASAQLVDYLEQRCKSDGYGKTLDECITNTKADADRGYTNDFTDPISTKPVKDRASALEAYKARMTYGFSRISTEDKTLVAPENAQLLLSFAYPDLSAQQRNEILAKTSIEAGYPFDNSSEGWVRINLAQALSAKVTLDTKGNVIAVESAVRPRVVVKKSIVENPYFWAITVVILLLIIAAVLIVKHGKKQTK